MTCKEYHNSCDRLIMKEFTLYTIQNREYYKGLVFAGRGTDCSGGDEVMYLCDVHGHVCVQIV